jgi:hypothetical protein
MLAIARRSAPSATRTAHSRERWTPAPAIKVSDTCS